MIWQIRSCRVWPSFSGRTIGNVSELSVRVQLIWTPELCDEISTAVMESDHLQSLGITATFSDDLLHEAHTQRTLFPQSAMMAEQQNLQCKPPPRKKP